MDQQLRDIERNYRANPKDKTLLRQLVANRRRTGYVLHTVEDLSLDQEEIHLRYQEIQGESRNSYKKFEKFYAALFVEHPALERITIRLWLPEFKVDAEKIMDQLWVFGEHIEYRFGLNVQVDIYRHQGPAPDSDTSRIHADGVLALEIQPYECGY